jgi:hypothetical protein
MKPVDGRWRVSVRVLIADLEEVHKVQCSLRNVDPFGGVMTGNPYCGDEQSKSCYLEGLTLT